MKDPNANKPNPTNRALLRLVNMSKLLGGREAFVFLSGALAAVQEAEGLDIGHQSDLQAKLTAEVYGDWSARGSPPT